MSISTHLSPEPERRLWILFESMRQTVEWTDKKIGALTAFAAAQLAFVKFLAPAGPLGLLAMAALCAALPLSVFAFSAISGKPKWLPFVQPAIRKHDRDDCMVSAQDISKYSHSELIHRLDRYLGGGITSTHYYEDIVGEILLSARIAARKQRLFQVDCIVVGIAQLGLLGQLIWR